MEMMFLILKNQILVHIMETKRALIYLLAIFFLSCEKNNQFFVDSINGNDNNSGSKNEPFYSLEKINDTKLTEMIPANLAFDERNAEYLDFGILFGFLLKLL